MDIDFTSIEQTSRALFEATREMDKLAPEYAKAKQIREYDGDRRKRVLSLSVCVFLEAGESNAAAEHKARAEKSYAEAMKRTGADLQSAEETIARWQALQCRFEALRSLLSCAKAIANI